MDEPYGPGLADIYDMFYVAGRNKDYATEAASLVTLIEQRRPGARSLLDVACGTGEHLRHLRPHFAQLEGLELAEPMLARASAKLPGVPLHGGDMRDFRLGRTFDVVTCLFSSIGYTRSVGELHAAVAAMAAHLGPDGLLVIDPWYHPDGWQGGYLEHTVAIADGRTVLRLAQSRRHDRTSCVTYHYLVGDASGITHFTDRHEMTLFTQTEYTAAMHAAGLTRVEHIAGWAQGRGRMVAFRDQKSASSGSVGR